MSDNTQLTTLGNLDPKLASALCYVPIMSINIIASLAFFFTEKENKLVRFHAAQGLMFVVTLMVSGFVFGLVYGLGTVFGIVVDGVLGTDGLISLLVSLLLLLLMMLFLAVVVLLPFGLAAMAYMEMPTRLPILAGLAERIAGLESGWND
ncbi:MAG: hypothetical protein H6737_21680 [Alphaproteobacteria bacterium]|nr:hypothetical protein [Alphaproteobacteria bacterium]